MSAPRVGRWPLLERPLASCGLTRSDVHDALHVGLIVDDGQGPYLLHMPWHGGRVVASLPGPAVWWQVHPDFALEEVEALVQFAAIARAKLATATLPFGLAPARACFTKKGKIELGGASGLNCVTFITLLFERAGVSLLEPPLPADLTADRIAEDRAAQQQLVTALRVDHPKQAALIEAEVGAPRVRAEEVAAASGMPSRPVAFAAAAGAGVVLRRVIRPHRG